MNYYFIASGNLASNKHPDLDTYTKVKTANKYSIYVTSKWTKGLSTVFGEAKVPKFSVGDKFIIDGKKLEVQKVTPVIIDNDWTFNYQFENNIYRIEDQLK